MEKKLFDILKERGYVKDLTHEREIIDLVNGDPMTFYLGIDPTADSLHIGHFFALTLFRWLQDFGHHGIILIGGATALVGDPTGKSDMRKMLSKEEVIHNKAEVKELVKRFVRTDGDNPAIIVDNADWICDKNYIDFMRDYGVHFNINKMLASEIYNNRLENGGLTFFEMGYMPMQAYDFVHLNRTKGCTLQYGGADQWGNIVAGTELGRKMNFIDGKNRTMIGVTNPLLLTPEGKKMGKTEKGAIWIDNDKISAYDFYQGIYQTPDACVEMMYALFTDIEMPEVKEIINQDIVKAKKRLAYEITKFIRGEADAIEAENMSNNLFASRCCSPIGCPLVK